jgi:uncharacterized metal-binding protein YceD (DUF177 family)
MSDLEFSRPFDRRGITAEPVRLTANEAECAALAARFEIPSVKRLEAVLDVIAEGEVVHARGRMQADIVQTCAVSGEDLPTSIDERITLRFVPPRSYQPDEEIELAEDELDEIEFEGTAFDLGEAVAQSLALAIDPFAVGPEAERVRNEVLAAQEPTGPFASLAALKKPD